MGEGWGGREEAGEFTLAATLAKSTPGRRSCAAAATDPPTLTGDEKGEGNTSAETSPERPAASLARACEKEKGKKGEGEKRGEQRVWMLRFQLRGFNPARISTLDAG